MIKMVVVVILVLAAFLAAILIPMGMSGKLTKESLDKLLGKEEPKPEEGPAKASKEDILVRAIKDREEELDQREAKVREEEDRIRKMQSDLDQFRNELLTLQMQIQEMVKAEDSNRETRLKDVAQSLGKMKPANAAQTLSSWTPDDAADVLRLVKERERGRILDAMQPEQASMVLKSIQANRL